MNQEITQGRQRPFPILMTEQIRHRILILLLLAVAGAVTAALLFYGWDYYRLNAPMRPLSSMHSRLKPSGSVGLKLGFIGFGLFALVYLYPLRKRWTWLSRQGKAKNWLDFHMVLGLVAPVFITFHCAGKTQGFAGMAYWTMIALAASGLVGRYFYTQIPRTLDAATMTLKQMQELSKDLIEQMGSQNVVSSSDIAGLFGLPDVEEVQRMSLLGALYKMIVWDLLRPMRIWSLRRRKGDAHARLWTVGGILRSRQRDLELAISLVSKQAALAKKIVFLSKAERVFFLWHVIHRPFSLSFALFVVIHIGVVMSLGYF